MKRWFYDKAKGRNQKPDEDSGISGWLPLILFIAFIILAIVSNYPF